MNSVFQQLSHAHLCVVGVINMGQVACICLVENSRDIITVSKICSF